MRALEIVDDFLNNITMYRLLVYGLSGIAAVSIVFSLSGLLPLPTQSLLISLGILVVAAFATDSILGKIWHAVPNMESWLITALILFLILPPPTGLTQYIGIAVAGVTALASKYIVYRNNKHIFNPAASGAVAVGILELAHATWWVGSMPLWPFTLILGLLVVRKIRRFKLLISFLTVSLLITAATAYNSHALTLAFMQSEVLASPLLFLGTIMLTEPATMPTKNWHLLIFGAIVGGLYSLHPQLPLLYVYPEVALLIGNLYAFLVSPKANFNLRLLRREQLSERVYNYVFQAEKHLHYLPGQYMEWTLAKVAYDGRGNRRTFTIASAPREKEIMLGVKFYEPSSSFKRSLMSMQPGDYIIAGQVAGNFTLPKNPKQKLLFVAGGVGITPFRSMLQQIILSREDRDIILFYLSSSRREIVYTDVLQQAQNRGVIIVPIVSNTTADGKRGSSALTAELLGRYVKDIDKRKVYISGPNAMVAKTSRLLASQGVRRSHIITDNFSGY